MPRRSMDAAIQAHFPAFDGGPPDRVQRALGMIKPDDRRFGRRVLLIMLIGWVPPAVLALVQGYALRPDLLESFLDHL